MPVFESDMLLDGKQAEQRYRAVCASYPLLARCTRGMLADISADRVYRNAAELFLGTARVAGLMRLAGAEETFVCGDGSDYEKFRAFCTVTGDLCGNPLQTQAGALLEALLDCRLPICKEHCDEIWTHVAERLFDEPLSARSLAVRCGIKTLLCAAEPWDALADFAAFGEGDIRAMPVFCPDGLLDVASPAFPQALRALEQASGVPITDLQGLTQALRGALARFVRAGCRVAVHGAWPTAFCRPDPYHAEVTLQALLQGKPCGRAECDLLSAQLWRVLGQEYKKQDVLLELPSGGAAPLENIGISRTVCGGIAYHVAGAMLDYLASCEGLPRIALYVADPAEAAQAALLCGRYPVAATGVPQLALGVVLGTPSQTRERLCALAAAAPIGSTVGYFTDFRLSSSLLDHELLRRVLCSFSCAWGASDVLLARLCCENAAGCYRIE